MKIGYDAKRAYHNQTGLGHYSRNLLNALADEFPQNDYYLFNPKPSKLFSFSQKNIREQRPHRFIDRLFPSAWRSTLVINDLKRLGIQLYHGLSHEIPVGIHRTGIRTVVTMHDLIHERYPMQYSAVDVRIYDRKFRHACEHASKIIAISKQTRDDLVTYYKTPSSKIEVCYQSCNPAFAERVTDAEKIAVSKKYDLPPEFFLYVGSIIERKNLLGLCKAMFLLRNDLIIPLVVIGDGGKYKQQVKDFIKQNGLEKRIFFLSEHPKAKASPSFQSATDFPAIYQSAIAMIYPSTFEGFGIPVLESLFSRVPVITSRLSSLPEAGGDGALYVDPLRAEEIAQAMKRVYADEQLVETMKEKGWQHAQQFTPAAAAESVMNVYKELW